MTKGLPKSGIYNTGASTSAFFNRQMPIGAYLAMSMSYLYVAGRVAVQLW